MNKLIFVFAIFPALFSASFAQDTDICFLPRVVGSCKAAIPRYFYNATNGICEKFTYGGCDGNENNFESLGDCIDECGKHSCSLPVEIGPCRGAHKRFYYNVESSKCEGFIYGGCQGNGNNFFTLEECNVRCDVCWQPKDPGPCRAAKRRFAYNPKVNKCEPFIYGGCKGNENNFEDVADCIKTCVE